MGYDFIQFLAFLVDAGIIQSFRVTHDNELYRFTKR